MPQNALTTTTDVTDAGPPEIHFSSGVGAPEEKRVRWKISKMNEFLELSENELRETSIIFQAGQSIGISATWGFHFQHSTQKAGSVGMYLDFKTAAELESVNASFSVTLLSGDKRIIFLEEKDIKVFGEGDINSVKCWGWHGPITKAALLEATKETGRLEVILDLKVFPSKIFKPYVVKDMDNSGLSSLENDFQRKVVSDMQDLLESEHEADLTIKLPSENCSRKVHKLILITRSPVFARMLAADTKMLEGNTGEVVINDLSAKVLDVLLQYVYTGKVSHEWVHVPEEVINAAEKYNFPQLKHFCGHNLMQAVNIKNARKLHKLAKLLNLSFAVYSIKEFISKNIDHFLEVKDSGTENNEEQAYANA